MNKTHLWIAVVFVSGILIVSAEAKSPPKVVFISPGDSKFWEDAAAFMKAAAEDLGADLKVAVSGPSRFRTKITIESLFHANEPPEYLIFHFQALIGVSILEAAEKRGVRSFVFNTDTPPGEDARIGKPREKFRNWIGHLVPDDRRAGYILGETLVETAKKLNTAGEHGKIGIVGLSGSRESTAALYRNEGLRKLVDSRSDTLLHQIVFTRWNPQNAADMTPPLLRRYPDAAVVWAVSDGLALAAIRGIEKSGKQPGRDIVTGGIDWTLEAMEAVNSGKMTATIGGHFMDGAWALTMIYDYHQGIDFAEDPGVYSKSSMSVIDENNVADYLKLFGDRNWRKIDFKNFSKAYTPDLKSYDFSLDAVLRQFAQDSR